MFGEMLSRRASHRALLALAVAGLAIALPAAATLGKKPDNRKNQIVTESVEGTLGRAAAEVFELKNGEKVAIIRYAKNTEFYLGKKKSTALEALKKTGAQTKVEFIRVDKKPTAVKVYVSG